jgi:hypothetical protein
MYGSGVQYGFNNNPGTRSEAKVVELPLAPVRQHPRNNGGECACMNWHSLGIILSLLAAASLSLGVADIVTTQHTYIGGWWCNMYSPQYPMCDLNNLVWTWVGAGIWGSVPVFIFGILSIRKGSNPMLQNYWFEFVAFISGFIFTPAMVVISAIEISRGAGIYYWTYQSPLLTDDIAKVSIPIAIACLGFIEHIMCVMAFWDICCCQGKNMTTHHTEQVEVVRVPSGQVSGDYGRAGPSFPGSFYSNNMSSPSPTSYNYFSGMNNNKQFGGNQAYNYFR